MTLHVRAGRAILSPDRTAHETVDVRVDGSRIAAVSFGSDVTETRGGTSPTPLGDNRFLLMPALADAHDHGRGLPTLAFGAHDDALESWIPALSLQPLVDTALLTRLALAKLVRSGVGSVAHCHNTQEPDRVVDECEAAAAAAIDVGVRMAIAVPLSDRNRLGYGPDETVLECVAPDHRGTVADRWLGRTASVVEQLARVDELADRLGTDGPRPEGSEAGLVSVQYGPVAPQWCSDELLARVAEASARTGRRVHMHLFETRYQREWADAHYPGGLLAHLDSIGLLSDRLTVAHGVWLRDDELILLGERGVIVSINSSSNLRLRSGQAQVRRMLDANVRCAIGMDGMSIDDDDDALRELQVAHLLNAGVGFDRGVDREELLHASTVVGPVAVNGPDAWGHVVEGAPADLLLLDREEYASDVGDGVEENEGALVFARARARHVRHVIVAGREVVRDGVVLGIDEPAITAEVAARCRSAATAINAARPAVDALQRGLRRFYLDGLHQSPSVQGARR